MIKRTLIFLLLLSEITVAQKKPASNAKSGREINEQIDSVRAVHKNDGLEPFGNMIFFAGKFYISKDKIWRYSGQVYRIFDNSLYRIAEWLKLSDRHIIDSIHKTHPKLGGLSMPNSKIMLGIKLNPLLTNYISSGIQSNSKRFPGYLISDSSAAIVIALGINAGNVKNYRYHVVADDSIELQPWTIPKLEQQYGAKQPYGLIGQFKAPGKQLVIEVLNIKDYSIRDGVVLDWRINHKPIVTQLTAMAYYDNFTIRKKHARGYAKKFDEVTGLPSDLKFRVNSITQLSFDFKDHETIPYNISLKRDSSGEKVELAYAHVTGNHYDLEIGNYKAPGKYELVIQPGRFGDIAQSLLFSFEILPQIAEKGIVIKQLAPYILAIILLFSGWYIYYRQKLKRANQQKATANFKLSSVRAQLNPHFMFNALTSIQNLMNQQDTEGANHYLAKFAALTRQVLTNSGQELISLEDELQIITDYLQMEQLRFGFEYTIDVDAAINKANTEIPAMLLQPFIENAAKHGVSALQSKGKIDVAINKQGNNLVLTVEDNGPGFRDNVKTDGGFGLKLSEERIELLNQIYKRQDIDLQINSSVSGAKITITLTDWV